MSQVTLERPVAAEATELQNRLATEFQNPTPGRVPPLFQIDHPGDKVHLLVVWDEWRSLPLRDRSAIVLDAYEQAFGTDELLNVSVAMGLTSEEAERLGYRL